MTDDLFIPVRSHFENDNPWSASAGRMRCLILPALSEEPETSVLTAKVWEGPWALEFSAVEETCVFPLSEDGLQKLRIWLEEWRRTMENRPKRTLAENIARRNTAAASQST